MKVILTAQVSKLGQIGEVVEVKNGYAKNFLVPTKKAIYFTPNNKKDFESRRAEFEKANNDNLAQAKKIKEKLAGKDVIVIESASDDGRLYGSVNSASIANKINEIIGSKVASRSNVFLKKPIKEIGLFFVKIDLHLEVEIEARVIVSRSESEVEALLKAAKEAKNAAENAAKKSKKEEALDEEAVASEAQEGEVKEDSKPAKKTRKKKESA